MVCSTACLYIHFPYICYQEVNENLKKSFANKCFQAFTLPSVLLSLTGLAEGSKSEVVSLMLILTSLSRRREFRAFRSAGRGVTGLDVILAWPAAREKLHFRRFIFTQILKSMHNTK